MSREEFERGMLRDFAGLTSVAAILIGLALVAPPWVVGAACIVLIPAVVAAVILHALLSHRRDGVNNSELETAHSPSDASTAPGPGEPSPAWPGRLHFPQRHEA